MASPNELSLEEMLKYLLDNGGFVKNQDLVKHFKTFLIQPDTRVIARNKFKEYINTLATIKTKDGEKYLELKRKFRQPSLDISSPTLSFAQFPSAPSTSYQSPSSPLREPPPYRLPPSPISGPSASGLSSITSPTRRYPPETYNANSPISEPISEECESNESFKFTSEEDSSKSVSSPPVPPRRKSQDKIKIDKSKESSSFEEKVKSEPETIMEDDSSTNQLTPAEQLSVRERMQRFNKMATETDLPARPSVSSPSNKKRTDKSAEEDDRASVASQLDGKSREWLVKSAQGDYQALAKLAAEDPRLTRVKEEITPAIPEEHLNIKINVEQKVAGSNTTEKKFVTLKAFKCMICNALFREIEYFKKHKLTHSQYRKLENIPNNNQNSVETKMPQNNLQVPEPPDPNKQVEDNQNVLESNKEILEVKCEPIFLEDELEEEPENVKIAKPPIFLKKSLQSLQPSILQQEQLNILKNAINNTDSKMIAYRINYQCDKCEESFDTYDKLYKHTTIHKFEPSERINYRTYYSSSENAFKIYYKCSYCMSFFESLDALKDHEKNHQVKKSIPSSILCEICGLLFKASYLSKHMIKHSNEKPYKCDICGNSYTDKGYLRRHYRSHTGERPYECNICGSKFTRSSSLNIHKNTHSDARPYRCIICDKGFKRPAHLLAHKRIHTGEKPRKCDQCDQSFNQRASLLWHKKSYHSTVMPYKCKVCGRCYDDLNKFGKHKKTHNPKAKTQKCNKKSFQCNYCEKYFSQKSILIKHVKIHETHEQFDEESKVDQNTDDSKTKKYNKKSFQCNYCEKIFSHKTNLIKHVKIHEKLEDFGEENKTCQNSKDMNKKTDDLVIKRCKKESYKVNESKKNLKRKDNIIKRAKKHEKISKENKTAGNSAKMSKSLKTVITKEYQNVKKGVTKGTKKRMNTTPDATRKSTRIAKKQSK